MINSDVTEVIKEIANKHGISPTILEKAWRNQFKVVKETMQEATRGRSESFKTIYIRGMGKFIPRVNNIERMGDVADRRDT